MNLPRFIHRPSFEQDMLRRLRELPVDAVSPGFADGLASARKGAGWHFGVGLALAASIVVAVGIGTSVVVRNGWLNPPPEAALVTLLPDEVQAIGLRFRSERALSDVTIELQVPEGIELAGYPGQRTMSWTVDLQVGANRLDLPVIVRRGVSGVLVASLLYGQDRKQFAVRVKAREPVET